MDAPAWLSRQKKQGTFEAGVWLCACHPPRAADFRQVKKKGPNQGRWFYTCPRLPELQCGFFLFEDLADALGKKKMLGQRPHRAHPNANALANPGGMPMPRGDERLAGRADTPVSDVASTAAASGPAYLRASSVFPPLTVGRQRMFTGIPRPSYSSWDSSDDNESDSAADSGRRQSGVMRPSPVPTPATLKRKRPENEGVGEPEGGILDLSDLDSDDALLLAELADRTERQHQASQRSRPGDAAAAGPSTPPPARDAGMRTGFGPGGLPTPNTGNSFSSPSFPSTRCHGPAQASSGSPGSPASKRLRTAAGPAAGPGPATATATATTGAGGDGDVQGDAEITRTVLRLLQREPVSAGARGAVREALNLHALRARGVEMARDMLRDGNRAKEARIAELQARVVQLEGERRAREAALRRAVGELRGLVDGGACTTTITSSSPSSFSGGVHGADEEGGGGGGGGDA